MKFFDLLAILALPAHERVFENVIEGHCLNDMSGIAAALQLYRRQNGEYPEQLDVLVPDYTEKLYNDPVSGEPYHYKREGDHFRLWGVGADQKNHGGVSAEDGGELGDIVWVL